MRRNPPPTSAPDEAPEVSSELLDLRDKPPAPLAPSPQSLGVWELAWPTILSMLTQTLVRWVDFMMVGSLGPDALAAVGVGGQFYWLVQSIGAAVPTGVVALLARSIGARDMRQADAALRQGIWFAVAVSAVTMALILPFSDAAIAIYGVEESVIRYGSDYLYWLVWGTVPLSLSFLFGSALRAAGDSRTPLVIGVIANVLNVFFNWVLIFGNLGFPALGVSGAAIASSLSMVIQLAVFWWLWVRGRTLLERTDAGYAPDPSMLRRILKIGYPAALEGALFQVGLMAFMRLLGIYGTAAVAAYNIGAQILSMSFLPGIGFGTAAATLVGQHLGDENPAEAERFGWRSLGGAVATMSALGITVVALAEPIARLFTDDAEVIALTVEFIWLLGAVQPLMAVEFTLGGALRGAGDTRFPLIAIFCGLFLFRLLPAAIAAHVFESTITFVWGMLVFDYLIKAILLLWRFRSGRWKTIEV